MNNAKSFRVCQDEMGTTLSTTGKGGRGKGIDGIEPDPC